MADLPKFYTEATESHKLGTFFNDLTGRYGKRWDLVNLTTVNDGFVSYVTYRVDPLVKAVETPRVLDDFEAEHGSTIRYV